MKAPTLILASEQTESPSKDEISSLSGPRRGLSALPVMPEAQPIKAPQPVTVNIGDCLACSGCVTSAETVLLTHQTTQHFVEALEQRQGRPVVVSLSLQSIVSIAQRWKLEPMKTVARISRRLKRLGVSRVYTHSMATMIALHETYCEWLNKFQAMQEEGEEEKALPSTTGLVLSTCPGWVCYAEKTPLVHSLVPHLSKIKSPQQITGLLIKMDKEMEACFHVAVMPCYDKKLEAARKENQGEVDTVLTTSELFSLVEDGDDANDNDGEIKVDILCEDDPVLWMHPGGSAGGYLEHILTTVLAMHPGYTQKAIQLSKDFTEYVIQRADGTEYTRFASINGFKNIQQFARKRQSAPTDRYSLMQIMACPGACLNGAGQLSPLLSDLVTGPDADSGGESTSLFPPGKHDNAPPAIMDLAHATHLDALQKRAYMAKHLDRLAGLYAMLGEHRCTLVTEPLAQAPPSVKPPATKTLGIMQKGRWTNAVYWTRPCIGNCWGGRRAPCYGQASRQSSRWFPLRRSGNNDDHHQPHWTM